MSQQSDQLKAALKQLSLPTKTKLQARGVSWHPTLRRYAPTLAVVFEWAFPDEALAWHELPNITHDLGNWLPRLDALVPTYQRGSTELWVYNRYNRGWQVEAKAYYTTD